MKPLFSYVVLLLSCYGLVIFTAGSPLPPPAPEDNSDTSPDLTNMLGMISGMDFRTLLGFLKEFKTGGNILMAMMKESPPFRQVVESASQQNVKLRLLMKSVEGKFPDFQELYQLATTKGGSMISSLNAEASKNPQWNQFRQLISREDLLSSYDSLSKLISIFTGGEVDLSPSMLKDMENGISASPSNDSPYGDLVRVLVFLHDNLNNLRQIAQLLLGQSINYNKINEYMINLDFRHFPGLPTSQRSINNGKYTVTGGIKADPDAARIYQDYEHLKSLGASAANASDVKLTILDITERFIKMLSDAIAKAESGSKSSKQGRLTGVAV